MNTLRVLLAASLSTTGFAQTTWVVDSLNGPGTDFDTIGAAVAAAFHGDTIRVRAGTYGSFTLDKGVRLVGEGAVNVSGGFSVLNLPAGTVARVSNVTPQVAHPPAAFGFRVLNCDGSVHLTEVDSPDIGGDASIANSAFVTVHRCSLVGTLAAALVVDSSTVQVSSTTMYASVSAFDVAGLRCTNSEVSLGSCSLAGTTVQLFGAPTPGVVMNGGTLRVATDTEVFAGFGLGQDAPAISVTGGTVVRDPDANLVPVGVSPPIAGTVNLLTQRYAAAAIDAAAVGGSFDARFVAPPGTTSVTFLGAPTAPLPTLFGPLEVGGSLTVIDSGVIPPGGERAVSFFVSASTPPGLAVAVQGLLLENGQISLSSTSTVVLGV